QRRGKGVIFLPVLSGPPVRFPHGAGHARSTSSPDARAGNAFSTPSQGAVMLSPIPVKLRWKILIPLIGLSLFPLAAALVVASNFAGRQLEKDLEVRLEATAALIRHSARTAQQEKANYVGLLARD